MLGNRIRSLAVIGAAIFVSGAPRSVELPGQFVTTLLVTAPIGLAVVGAALLLDGHRRTRLAGLTFMASILQVIPPLAVDLQTAVYVSAVAGSLVLATGTALSRGSRLGLIGGAACAALLVAFFGPLAGSVAPPEGLVLTGLGLGVAIGVLLFALDTPLEPKPASHVEIPAPGRHLSQPEPLI